VCGGGALHDAQQGNGAGGDINRRFAIFIFVLVLGIFIVRGPRRRGMGAGLDLLGGAFQPLQRRTDVIGAESTGNLPGRAHELEQLNRHVVKHGDGFGRGGSKDNQHERRCSDVFSTFKCSL